MLNEQDEELTLAAVWEARFAEVCQEAGLTELQAACYRLHSRRVLPLDIARAVLPPLTAPPLPVSLHRRAWTQYHRAEHRQIEKVRAAVEQAEEKILRKYPEYLDAGYDFRRQVVQCAANRCDWSRLPGGGEEMGSERDRLPSARVLTAADLRRPTGTESVRLFTQGLAADFEQFAVRL